MLTLHEQGIASLFHREVSVASEYNGGMDAVQNVDHQSRTLRQRLNFRSDIASSAYWHVSTISQDT